MPEVLTQQTYHSIGAVDSFPVGKGRRVELDGRHIAVWRLDDGFYAIDDACPHQQASLAFGKLEGHILACPRHGSEFDLHTGRVVSLPSTRGVHSYPVKVENGEVLLCPEPTDSHRPDLLKLP